MAQKMFVGAAEQLMKGLAIWLGDTRDRDGTASAAVRAARLLLDALSGAGTAGYTASDGVVQHDRDMQQNSCRVELNGFSVELDGKVLKSCARVQRITFEVPKSPGSGSLGRYPDIWLIHELRDVNI
ncbi:hypothetical protein EV426DRAFT_578197 [Tirmania nivea]|nr:hypothetical protein EV426DRAFT_578197 [Tirmania nivea]